MSIASTSIMERRTSRVAVWSYPIAAFFGAFLLFALEPLIAKSLMPLLGGAPSIWLMASAFFQTTLLIGYAYAHATCLKIGNWKQIRLHAILLCLVAWLVPVALPTSSPSPGQNPAIWQLGWMALVIAPCFIALAASAPLLQRWYVDLDQPDAAHPYRLYAASNLGSFVGLAAFPLLLEPTFGLQEQAMLWRVGFILQILLMVASGFQVPMRSTAAVKTATSKPTAREILTWAALAAIPSSLTLGLTQYLTGEVVSAPAFWAIPLALYLLSFVAAFSGAGATWLRVGRAVLPYCIVATILVLAIPLKRPMTGVIVVHTVTLFFAALVCHGEIARRKPVGEHATSFMLWISVGGVFGALINTLIAPILFSSYIEYPAVLLLCGFALPFAVRPTWRKLLLDSGAAFLLIFLALGAILLERQVGLTSSVVAKQLIFVCAGLSTVLASKYPIRFVLCLCALLAVGAATSPDRSPSLFRVRSFFGVSTVDDEVGKRRLQHGRILHGVQSLSPALRHTPLSYYYPTGPIGQTIAALQLGPSARVAVVGLGAGSMACYATPGQTWDFYEIDPAVAKLAQDPTLFTFVSDCKGNAKIIVGDGRLELARSSGNYDLIVLDAYSSDSVPVHLMTVEATELYLQKLSETGVLAFHVSNRYFRLELALQKIAEHLSLSSIYQIDDARTTKERQDGKTASDWFLTSKSQQSIDKIFANGKWKHLPASGGVSLWTDDRNSVFEVFKGFDARD